jgi:hypothetical protein
MGSRPDSDDDQGTLDLGAPAAADDAVAPANQERETSNEEPVPFTWTEAWRRQCEARHVMHLLHQARRDYYAGVRKQRGEAAMKELIAEVNRQWVLANPI